MKTPINFEQLWEVVNSGKTGYLVIDPKTGLSSITSRTRKMHISGLISGDPLWSQIFSYEMEELGDLWSSSRNITEFCNEVNDSIYLLDKPILLDYWANHYNYQHLGKWMSHGLPGIYHIQTHQKVDEIDGYYTITPQMLVRLSLEDQSLLAGIYGKLFHVPIYFSILLKPEGQEFRIVGEDQRMLTALTVPELYRPLIDAIVTCSKI